MVQNYSIWSLIKHALSGKKWTPTWQKTISPKPSYDVIIIGGGGHGLATAYYLAHTFNITNVAVVEKGWLGGGNVARNTTIVRSNYLHTPSAMIYEHALKLWKTLSAELVYNVMFSQRGVFNLAHDETEKRDIKRRVNANQLNGIHSQWKEPDEIKNLCPIININENCRFPVLGGSFQPDGGVARHDAVAWGFAHKASLAGVDIIEQCEVIDIKTNQNRISEIITTKGNIKAGKVAIVAAANSSVLANMAGFDIPIKTHPLQALVSEPVKPIMPTVVMSNAVHAYVSQSDKGELVVGAGIDGFQSYVPTGSFNVIEASIAALLQLFPTFSRLKMMRQWAGNVDIAPDASPIIGHTPVKDLYINCGWGTGGFKATPGSGYALAHTIAYDKVHETNKHHTLERFFTGALVAEHGAAAVAH
ncbi:sarcosine oxidase subunit beta family protein [Fastidiosibacteraceae bacterium SYSU SYW-5]